MRKAVLAAAGLAILAAVSWNAAPAQAMAISAPAALKGASDSISLTERFIAGIAAITAGRAATAATTGRITAPITAVSIGPTHRPLLLRP